MTGGDGLESFEPFDPIQEPTGQEITGMEVEEMTDEFEEFDVAAEPEAAGEEVSVEALGELTESEEQLRSLLAARDEAEQRLMPPEGDFLAEMAEDGTAGLGNVVGVGIAEKEMGGNPTGQLGVTVFVKEKVSPSKVSGEALVPDSIGGVATDVEAIGEVSAQRFTNKLRPAPGGVSIGSCLRVHAGTLGCLVHRSNQLFILSNNHVMGVVNKAPVNTGVSQPGRLDGGQCPQDIIARLTQFVPITFGGQCNFVDAAIARTSPALVDRRILRPGGVREPLKPPVRPPALNTLVQKSGRTTQFTRGIINAVNVTVNVSYAPEAGVARFCRQFRVRGIPGPFSAPGDSGSLVTTAPRNEPVGLLFAGNAQSNTTFCNPITQVLNSFGVQIVF
jgi:hypothetical protein